MGTVLFVLGVLVVFGILVIRAIRKNIKKEINEMGEDVQNPPTQVSPEGFKYDGVKIPFGDSTGVKIGDTLDVVSSKMPHAPYIFPDAPRNDDKVRAFDDTDKLIGKIKNVPTKKSPKNVSKKKATPAKVKQLAKKPVKKNSNKKK